MNPFDLLIMAGQGLLLFLFGTAGFDTVHYILHVWENSRFAILRKLGKLHAVHHDFLDRGMRIQRHHSRLNILNHVIPEYVTGCAGVVLLGVLLKWYWATAAVVLIRTVMVAVYVYQKGEDFTHAEMSRVPARRSLFFVGPAYHALHHVYVTQHYSSFLNIFDLIVGTNCQIAGRNFLIAGEKGKAALSLTRSIEARGGTVRYAADFAEAKEGLEAVDVLIFADGTQSPENLRLWFEKFIAVGLTRLVPPEVWLNEDVVIASAVGPARSLLKDYRRHPDLTLKKLRAASTVPSLSFQLILRGI